MADNFQVNIPSSSGDTFAADDIGAIKWQRIKLTLGADGVNDGDVASANPLPVKHLRSGTGTQTSVASAAVDTAILASNANRLGAVVYNDSDRAMYLLAGSGAASTSAFTVKLFPTGAYEIPANYTGAVRAIWDAGPTGSARITEYT